MGQCPPVEHAEGHVRTAVVKPGTQEAALADDPPRPAHGRQRLAIGVMGASGGDLSGEVRERCYRLGEAIATQGAVLITGACPGLPYEAVRGAKAAGGLVIGISPGLSIDEHRGKYRSPVDGFDVQLAIAYDEGRLIGVLTGTGGITTLTEEIIRVSAKTTGACVVYDHDPVKLIDRLLHVYRTSHYRKPSCFCDAPADGT